MTLNTSADDTIVSITMLVLFTQSASFSLIQLINTVKYLASTWQTYETWCWIVKQGRVWANIRDCCADFIHCWVSAYSHREFKTAAFRALWEYNSQQSQEGEQYTQKTSLCACIHNRIRTAESWKSLSLFFKWCVIYFTQSQAFFQKYENIDVLTAYCDWA